MSACGYTLRRQHTPVFDLVSLTLAALLLGGVVVSAGHADCHADDGEPCAICTHLKIPCGTVEISTSPVVTPLGERVMPWAAPAPLHRPVLTSSARAPPPCS